MSKPKTKTPPPVQPSFLRRRLMASTMLTTQSDNDLRLLVARDARGDDFR